MSDRRIDPHRAERISWQIPHAAITANASEKLYKVATGQKLVITRAHYVNPTGLAVDNTNAFKGELKKTGAVVCATLFNTDGNDAPAGAALVADTFAEGTLATAQADRVLNAGEELSLVFTEDGDATLPAGRLIIEGYLL